jgi:hypothetical protein
MAARGPIEERFWDKVNRDGPIPAHMAHLGPCWVWTASTRGGYGSIGISGRMERSHRVSWELANGPIPAGLCVLHHCDNPLCVNPGHLFLGTKKDNAKDMYSKGRRIPLSGDDHPLRRNPELCSRGDSHWARQRPEGLARGDDHWTHRHAERVPRGEKHHGTRITEAQAREVLRLRASGVTGLEIARRFGLPNAIVYDVGKRTWLHLVTPGQERSQ